ncbi:MAG: hemolysin III family protein [Nonlabens sp.]
MPRAQTQQEEYWNVVTHGFGAVVFLALSIYVIMSPQNITTIQWTGIVVYLFSQCFLYVASTSYHYITPGVLKFKLRKLDHISIYGSIAGTYTPICLITLEQSNGYLILAIVWGIALFGTIWKLFFTGKFEIFSSILYLIMGWMVVIDIGNLQKAFTDLQMHLLIAGGVFFTVGIIFYAWNKLYFNHVIWHLFVLGGSLSHFAMVYHVLDF